MRGILIRVKCYNYVNKDKIRKVGRIVLVQSSEPKEYDDGNGNIDYGYSVEEIVFKNEKIKNSDIIEKLGHECEFIFERSVGDRYQNLVGIELVGKE
jgi:hypothetical protein